MDASKDIRDLLKRHKSFLKFQNVAHPKFLILFSGIPASGKTYSAKILEEQYEALRINSDDLRKLIMAQGKKYPRLREETFREQLLVDYLMYLIENAPLKNKRMILDSGIERKYDRIAKAARKHGYKTFIIKIICSKKVASKRARKRMEGTDAHFNKNIDRWRVEFNRFSRLKREDITIRNDTDKELDLRRAFEKLDAILGKNSVNPKYMSNKHKL